MRYVQNPADQLGGALKVSSEVGNLTRLVVESRGIELEDLG